jgi:hypothetical protein
MHRPTGARGWLLVLVLITAAGCRSIEVDVPGGPATIPEEHMPRWASFVLRGEPDVAANDLHLEIASAEDGVAFNAIDIPTGTVIRWNEVVGEGRFRLRSREPACTLDLRLPPEQSTPIVFHHEPGACAFAVADPVDVVESGHLSATVTIQPWSDFLVEAVSLDEPRQPVPEPVPPDEGGLAQLFPLWPGRYEIRLRRGDEILERHVLDVAPTGPQDSSFELTLDGIQD